MNLNNWEWGSQSFFRLKRARCADCFPEFQLNIGGRFFRLYSQIRSLGERLMRRSRRSNSKRWLFSAFEDSPRISLEAEASFCSEWSEFLHPHRNLFFLQPSWGALSSLSFDRNFDEWLKHNCGVYVKYTQKALAVAKQRQVVGWVNKGDENQRNSLLLGSSCFSGFL